MTKMPGSDRERTHVHTHRQTDRRQLKKKHVLLKIFSCMFRNNFMGGEKICNVQLYLIF